MSSSRAHITFPKEVRADLDRLVDKRDRSKLVTDAVRKELLLVRQRMRSDWPLVLGRIKIIPSSKLGPRLGSKSSAASRKRISKSSFAPVER